MIVSGPNFVSFRMGKLALDYVRRKAMLVMARLNNSSPRTDVERSVAGTPVAVLAKYFRKAEMGSDIRVKLTIAPQALAIATVCSYRAKNPICF